MCGRIVQATPAAVIGELFGVEVEGELEPRYNVAPTQCALVVRQGAQKREAAVLRWGLVPAWASDPAIGQRLINARAETVRGKPAFRSALRSRRCLVPVTGFYEWRRMPGQRQPYFISGRSEGCLALAGLWECWGTGEAALETFTILTTRPNALIAALHDRMPVIVDAAERARWLDRRPLGEGELERILAPFPGERMQAWPVTPRVGNPHFDDRAALEPIVIQEGAMRRVHVGAIGDLPPGTVRQVPTGGITVAVFSCHGSVLAIRDLCTHARAVLSEGTFDPHRCTVECPLHGAGFDLRTGAALAPPATAPVAVYPVVVDSGEVFVEVPD